MKNPFKKQKPDIEVWFNNEAEGLEFRINDRYCTCMVGKNMSLIVHTDKKVEIHVDSPVKPEPIDFDLLLEEKKKNNEGN